MINVAFVIDTIESPTAGTEKQLLLLLKHLDRSEFKPYLCVLTSSEWLENEFSDCDLYNIELNSFKNLKSYLSLLKFISFLKSERIDIVQTQFIGGNKVGVIAARLAGIKSIISTRRNQGYWHTSLELIFLRFLNRWVKCFLANSYSTAQWLSSKEKIDPQRIEVIHNGLELENFYRGSEEQYLAFRDDLDFPSDVVIICLVANLRSVKAVDVFLRAAKKVSDQTSKARFVIIGEGPEREPLEMLCKNLGLESRVLFLGRRMDIPQVLSCVDIGVLTSNSESFSNSILEYTAAGLAVVCTDVGGAKEVIEEGVNGYVIRTGDSCQMAERLICLIANDQYGTMGRQGRARALRMFSHKNIFDLYQQLYRKMI